MLQSCAHETDDAKTVAIGVKIVVLVVPRHVDVVADSPPARVHVHLQEPVGSSDSKPREQ
jgi:hypothetical protein